MNPALEVIGADPPPVCPKPPFTAVHGLFSWRHSFSPVISETCIRAARGVADDQGGGCNLYLSHCPSSVGKCGACRRCWSSRHPSPARGFSPLHLPAGKSDPSRYRLLFHHFCKSQRRFPTDAVRSNWIPLHCLRYFPAPSCPGHIVHPVPLQCGSTLPDQW